MGGGSASQPNYDAAARAGVAADLNTYPMRYLTSAAAKMGGKVTIDGQTYDFTGLGDADNAAKMSDEMAATLLDIQQNYGPQYVQQRLDELKQADPQGYAARQQLFDKIIADSKAQPDRPMADDTQQAVLTELQNAGKLDPAMLHQVQEQVRGGQVAKGNYLGNAATSQEAGAAVKASDTLRDQQQQQALGFLQSGVTPEDVQYRRIQQSLQNLGAFQSGQTPAAAFKSLSSAGNTAAPFTTSGPVGVGTNPNAGTQGVQNALGIYSGNVNWASSQVNPYVAGISTGLSSLGTYGALGGFSNGTPAINPTGGTWATGSS
ncbi:MAG TPA: hypothetical protein VHA37_04575 [Candidatus Saccharimonadales bacterium]|nr:hypothetical protein [Candidatus Saccharimonadales bacterium]